MMGPIVFLSNVSLSYGEDAILNKINLTFESGKCHVIMGPNGGGKTSLVRSILGLTPYKGDIELQWPQRSQRSKPGSIGYVPQKAVFEPSLPLTVMDFVLLNQTRTPLFWRRKSRQTERAMELLSRVGMAQRHDRKMGQLSGGEQQRVLLAQALLDDPGLLILDEPTTGMDEQGVAFMENLIHDSVKQGKTVIAIHHDVNAVRRLDAQVYVVNRNVSAVGHHTEVLNPERIESLFQHYTAKTEAA